MNLDTYQEKLDSSSSEEEQFLVVNELYSWIKSLSINELSIKEAFLIQDFFRRNINSHILLSTVKEKSVIISDNDILVIIDSFKTNLTSNSKLEKICLLLEKANSKYSEQIRKILLNNMDITDHIMNLAANNSKQKIDLSLAKTMVCHTDCFCYEVEFKANEYKFILNYEPKINYIEFSLYLQDKFIGIIDEKTFLKNFKYE